MASVSLMQDEQLAKDVTLYPTLYDKSDKGYKERILKFFGIGHFQQNLLKRPHRGYAFTCCLEDFQKSPLLAKNFLNALVPQK